MVDKFYSILNNTVDLFVTFSNYCAKFPKWLSKDLIKIIKIIRDQRSALKVYKSDIKFCEIFTTKKMSKLCYKKCLENCEELAVASPQNMFIFSYMLNNNHSGIPSNTYLDIKIADIPQEVVNLRYCK